MHGKELGTGLVAAIKKQLGLKIGGHMRYPIDVKPDGKFFLVTFPNIPEAITQGKSLKEAKEVAANALETALDFYFENSRVVPKPSRIKRGQDFVELPASVSAKVLLLNEMIRQRVRPAELARRMQTTPQEVNRLTNIRHTSRIDGIAGAMKALGKTLEIRAV
jgi:antitoxin HicB